MLLGGACFTCDSSCNTCNGPSPTQCLSCKISTQYPSVTGCVACISPCLTCQSDTICSSCIDGKYLSLTLTC